MTKVITARIDEPTLIALDAVRTSKETRSDVVRLAIQNLLAIASIEPRTGATA